MSFQSGGFTEDDQAKIAEEVLGRVQAKRSGLGFSGSADNVAASTNNSSSASSSWFHQAESVGEQPASGKDNQDTTEGAFPWDGGQRGKAGGAVRKQGGTAISSLHKEQQESVRPTVREFPMVRERDIERSEGGRDGKSKKRGRSRSRDRDRGRKDNRDIDRDRDWDRERSRRKNRSRSRSRSRGGNRGRDRSRSRSRGRSRGRSRSRSCSGGRERDSRRERLIEEAREREYQRQRQRDREKERENQRARDRSRERERDQRRTDQRSGSLEKTSRGRDRRGRDIKDSPADGRPVGKDSSLLRTPAQAKIAMKRRLRQVVAGDATLKTGFQATLGGGTGWERAEMSAASEFFKGDEVAAKGGVASVAPEYEARLAEILAVEDEDTVCLGEGMKKTVASAAAGGEATMGFDPSTRAHHDAIFAPTGSSDVSQPDVLSPPSGPTPVAASAGRVGSAGVMGAAARARLVLTGKADEESTKQAKSVTKIAHKRGKKSEERPPTPEDNSDKPLFKTLRSGESVEARYTADDKWYKAVVLQVIHGGFEIARYKVRYSEYGNEETLSWKSIRRLESAQAPPAPTVQTVEEQPVVFMQEAPAEESEPVLTEEDNSKPFAGMRPRSLCIEHEDPPKTDRKINNDAESPSAAVVDVVNPVILSTAPGRKLSWKEKLQARKAGASSGSGPSGGADGVRILPKKEISLVPDFAAQRKEEEVKRVLDKSGWRSKVIFGMGGSKRHGRS